MQTFFTSVYTTVIFLQLYIVKVRKKNIRLDTVFYKQMYIQKQYFKFSWVEEFKESLFKRKNKCVFDIYLGETTPESFQGKSCDAVFYLHKHILW